MQFLSGITLDKDGDEYILAENGKCRRFDASSLLQEISRLDLRFPEKKVLSLHQATSLEAKLAGRRRVPHFDSVFFASASSALFAYLSDEDDPVLLRAVADAMGWKDLAQVKGDAAAESEMRRLYLEYWSHFAQSLLTREGFDAYHFGALSPYADGTYLYDEEKVVGFVTIGFAGREERKVSFTFLLTGNPEAIMGNDEERSFQWCCYLDELLEKEAHPLFLGGALRAVDPFGVQSRVMRKYEISYPKLDAEAFATVIAAYCRYTEMLPPEEKE